MEVSQKCNDFMSQCRFGVSIMALFFNIHDYNILILIIII
jgi:hypothetical protein